MDFYQIKEREAGPAKKPVLEIYPDFKVVRSHDLMTRAKNFYAVWDEKAGLWSTDEYDVQRLVDEQIMAYEPTTTGYMEVHRKLLGNFSSSAWLQFRNYIGHLSDHYTQLDAKITFKNTEVKKEDFVSRRLPYDLLEGDISAWDELVGTLYDSEERKKIEWIIGAIMSGDSTKIQKFGVFYGPPGSGKSTIMNVIQWLCEGYVKSFVAKDLTGANNQFALEPFKTNPIVAIDHDADLSKIQDNTKLNSLVSHEPQVVNEKNKPQYSFIFMAFLLIGSNKPVKITDAKSGLIRRLIDIHPTERVIPVRKYQSLMNQIRFELGAIAYHCLEVYRSMGKDYYSGYRPVEMMLQTDIFFNFIEANYDIFQMQDGISLNQAFDMYKEFVKESDIEFSLPKYKLREELKNYFEHFEERYTDEQGDRIRNWFYGFKADRFKSPTGKTEDAHMFSLVLEETTSLLDNSFKDMPAQYSTQDGSPRLYWDDSPRVDSNGKEFIPRPNQVVSTTLKDLDTSKEHYTKVPENHIVIDFDLKDKDGKKSAERNLEAASQWPPTYAEFSKSGEGIHLHYNYIGAVEELSSFYDDGIEIKVYNGNSSLRRKLSRCNAIPVADIRSGLPLKEKKVIDEKRIEDEKHLRALIHKALRKEINVGTKSNVDFIHKILEDTYASGQTYNVTDLRQKILNFAMNSSNQAMAAIKMVQTMKFASEDSLEAIEVGEVPDTFKSQKTLDADREVIFDVEVFPNLFVICWKYKGAPKESIVTMINPTPQEVEKVMAMKLVGFNCRKYDNHILYGAHLGYDNQRLYLLSKKIIENIKGATFGEAYNISYTDIFDFSSKKQSLKKWENELRIHHMELGLPWDKPVPKELWDKVAEYCANDVEATDQVRQHLEPDFIARQILSDLSGLSMNATTQQHTARIVFGDNRKPQEHFVYTDLSEMFPGYVHSYNQDKKKMESIYRGEITGEGGFVYAEPGMYENVVLLDIESMHPTSIEQLNLFGEYTKNFSDLKEARVAIKRKDYDKAKQMLNGKLARHLNDPSQAKALSKALKIAINIVYGLTSASFDNSFRDPRNVDNIVAKRGALFMIELKREVQARGFTVAHIKTDSIKIPNATEEIIKFVMEFGAKYGYKFVHEATYAKMTLVNDAVYIAKYGWSEEEDKIGKWEAVGAQFQHPYVYKYLFSKEEITFDDMCEAKSVQSGAMYLDYSVEDAPSDIPMVFEDLYDPEIHTEAQKERMTKMVFIGRSGLFTPVLPGTGGGGLVRIKDGKTYNVTGTSGFFWLESELVEKTNKKKDIDGSYFEKLINDAIDQIKKYGDYEWFVS